MKNLDDIQMKRINYEIFILLLTILGLFNFLIQVFALDEDIDQLANQINGLLSVIFLIDFLIRLRTAKNKRDYFFKQFGWLDLVSAIPIPGTKLARIVYLVRVVYALRLLGTRKLLRLVLDNRANTAILLIGLFVIYLLEFGSIFILRAEGNAAGANITSADDALWWVLVSISTVGYGDLYPVTNTGRFVATFVIIAGVGVFGTLAGFLANAFLGESEDVAEAEEAANTQAILQGIQTLQQQQDAAKTALEEANAALLTRVQTLEKLLQEKA